MASRDGMISFPRLHVRECRPYDATSALVRSSGNESRDSTARASQHHPYRSERPVPATNGHGRSCPTTGNCSLPKNRATSCPDRTQPMQTDWPVNARPGNSDLFYGHKIKQNNDLRQMLPKILQHRNSWHGDCITWFVRLGDRGEHSLRAGRFKGEVDLSVRSPNQARSARGAKPSGVHRTKGRGGPVNPEGLFYIKVYKFN